MERKEKWLRAAEEVISQRIASAEKAMKRAQEAANSEEKSSAGDKYETGRAMSQLERDMNARQLAQAKQELAQLAKLDLSLKTTVMPGSALKTSEGWYFIALGLGKMEFEGENCIMVAPASPLGKILLGKKPGDTLVWNEKTIDILELI